jgi:hypothetical protein
MADPEASIVVVAKHNPMSFLLNMTKFVLEIDGDTQVGSWGERVVGVAPGAHSVRMWFRYLGRECGVAAVSVNTTAGTTPRISYRAPIFVFSPGKASVEQ